MQSEVRKPQNGNDAEPVRLATLPRGTDGQHELRVEWAMYKGHHFVGIRQWFLSEGKWLPDGKRGISIKVRELGAVVEALQAALELAGE
jgi:hypothetical protein